MRYNINNEFLAYFIGFVQSDGTITEYTRNRGRISVEVNARDAKLIEQMQKEFEKAGINATIHYRSRDTQFKVDYESILLYIFDLEFRQFISKYIPSGKKSDTVQFIKDIDAKYMRHYIRGFIDGDGSVGIKGDGSPFISLWSVNENIMRGFENYFFNITGVHRTLNPTARDNGYSIMYSNEEAQIIIRELYNDCSICLHRKYDNALKALQWVRPDGKKKVKRQVWTDEQDKFILTHSIKESMEYLGRTDRSIKSRLFRLTH